MQEVDLETAKYRLGRLAHEFDSQVFIADIEEHYGGEFYNVVFQRGYHTYVLEVEGERFSSWFADSEASPDMVKAVKLAVEELVT